MVAQDRPPALRLREITKRFPGVLANDRVSFELLAGEIHGLLSENGAGKSTLMNIVFGLYQADGGTTEVNGQPVAIRSPQHAMELGIGMVHQHFMLVPDMTVAENIALGPSRLPMPSNLDEVARELRDLSRRFGLEVDPGALIEDLSVGEQQRVEITRMLYEGANVLILDEPSAALTPQEWSELAAFLRSLADAGSAVVLITHKLDELFGIADRCTVLRDGRNVGTLSMDECDKPTLARMMVGRDVNLRVEREVLEPGAPVLEVSGLTVSEDGRRVLDEINLEVRESEILGIAGVSGNGQSELVEAIVGLRELDAGTVTICGRPVHGGPLAFAAAGGALIPEDRHRDAVSLELSLADNLMMKDIGREPFSRRGAIDKDAVARHCRELIDTFDIRAPGPGVRIGQLSGGNQQKAVLARELSRDPKLLVAAQPTRGLDIGAIEFVYSTLAERKRAGCAILLISIELDEVLSLSDRIAVLAGGRIMGVLDAAEADAERIGLLMAGERVLL